VAETSLGAVEGRAPRARLRLTDRLYGRAMGLRPATPYRKVPSRVPTRDGVRLAADVYHPTGSPVGTLLMLGPYGRAGFYATQARQFAARGYQVVFASSRGTAGSEGVFDAMRTEVDDIQDVVTWMRAQPWYTGTFGAVGVSYLAYTAWALLADPPDDLKAVASVVGPHDFAAHTWGTGAFNLDLIGWAAQVEYPDGASGPWAAVRLAWGAARSRRAVAATPLLAGVDARFRKGRVPWLRERLLRDDLDDPYWEPTRFAGALDKVEVPVLIVSGWLDIFAEQSHEQYRRLRERGVDVALTVGPWTHLRAAANRTAVREVLDWLDSRLAGLPVPPRPAPVHVHMTGAGEWRHLDTFPPEATRTATLFLAEDGSLGPTPPGPGVTASFVYDPGEATPTVGGAIFAKGGYRPDHALAVRDDVLVFTGPPLRGDLDVLGTPVIALDQRAEHPDADLFVRISDVDRRGRSTNVTDGYLRVHGPGRVRIALLPTAHRFRAGHRVRLTVAGGSFPQFARSPGTSDSPVTAPSRGVNLQTVTLATSRLELPTAT
jgi:putative CocE/NonD family hydrolase